MKRRARLLQALCTLDESAGAALQIYFTRIQKANFFDSLLMLRNHVNLTTDSLGAKSRFRWECSESHQVYIRVKDSFKPGESDAEFQNLHQACSLLLLNYSPKSTQWKQADMKFDTICLLKVPVSEASHQKTRVVK